MPSRFEKLTFPGSQGATLAARLELPDGEPAAYALFAHCFTCTKDIFAAGRIAETLAAWGIAVLCFDFTGLGASEGDFAHTSFTSNVEDLAKAADFLGSNYAAPKILIGHSLGGAAVLAAPIAKRRMARRPDRARDRVAGAARCGSAAAAAGDRRKMPGPPHAAFGDQDRQQARGVSLNQGGRTGDVGLTSSNRISKIMLWIRCFFALRELLAGSPRGRPDSPFVQYQEKAVFHVQPESSYRA